MEAACLRVARLTCHSWTGLPVTSGAMQGWGQQQGHQEIDRVASPFTDTWWAACPQASGPLGPLQGRSPPLCWAQPPGPHKSPGCRELTPKGAHATGGLIAASGPRRSRQGEEGAKSGWGSS